MTRVFVVFYNIRPNSVKWYEVFISTFVYDTIYSEELITVKFPKRQGMLKC